MRRSKKPTLPKYVTEEEASRMIKATGNIRDRLIIGLLWSARAPRGREPPLSSEKTRVDQGDARTLA